MSKINILVINQDNFGIGYFRFIDPHMEIQKLFGDDFYVDFNKSPDWNDENYLNKFDIIFGSRNMMSLENAKVLLPQLKAKGKIIIIDIDDYWEVSPNHPQYQYAIETKYAEISIEFLKLADYITTTTEHFAKEIKKHNKNVMVFPNAIDPTNKKYKIETNNDERVKLGWVGGSSHLRDIQLLKPMFASINEKYKHKIQTILCGFDVRGKTVDRDPHGNQFERNLKPTETPWYQYEKIFTTDYQHLSKEYKEWLGKYIQDSYHHEEQYKRVWTKPMATYSLNYNLFDITLVPLEVNKFNNFKSQLKIIESGFFKKPVICSDVIPYQIDIKHGENGFLVKEKSSKDWAYYTKKLIENPELRKEMGEKLYETVKDKYNLSNVSTNRVEFYKSIIKKV